MGNGKKKTWEQKKQMELKILTGLRSKLGLIPIFVFPLNVKFPVLVTSLTEGSHYRDGLNQETIDLSSIYSRKQKHRLRLGWTKYSDLCEIVHPSLNLISLCLLTAINEQRHGQWSIWTLVPRLLFFAHDRNLVNKHGRRREGFCFSLLDHFF